MIKKHLAYLKYVVRHKWYVLQASRNVSLSLWQAIIHDWTKLLPSEWGPYADYFYAEDGSNKINDDSKHREKAFDIAWNHHQKRNRHHWQYWHLREDTGQGVFIEMPVRYVREMVADWIGASKAIKGSVDIRTWWHTNRNNIYMHPATEVLVDTIISKLHIPEE